MMGQLLNSLNPHLNHERAYNNSRKPSSLTCKSESMEIAYTRIPKNISCAYFSVFFIKAEFVGCDNSESTQHSWSQDWIESKLESFTASFEATTPSLKDSRSSLLQLPTVSTQYYIMFHSLYSNYMCTFLIRSLWFGEKITQRGLLLVKFSFSHS